MALRRGALLLLIIITLAACGRGTPKSEGVEAAEGRLSSELAQIAALACPDDVDPRLWEVLKADLAAALLAQSRSASVPPDTDQSRGEADFDTASSTLTFWFHSNGDYDQNGEVNAADLAPIASNFMTAGPFQYSSSRSQIDGDGNGEINGADIAPIARNFRKKVVAYNVYTSLDPADAPSGNTDPSTLEPIATIPFSAAQGNRAADRLSFTHVVENPVELAYYWVRPTDGESEGTRSGLAGGPPNDPPIAVLVVCPFHGPAPFEVELDASNSSDPDGELVTYRFDYEGDGTWDEITAESIVSHTYLTEGQFSPTVEVVDNLGKTARMSVPVTVGTDPNWFHLYPIGQVSITGGVPSLAVVDGLPAMVFLGNQYIRATNADATAWSEPSSIVPGAEYNPKLFYLEGRPVLVHFSEGLKVARGEDSTGEQWGEPQLIAPAWGFQSIILSANGLPLAVLRGPAPGVRLTRATSADGMTWSAPVEVPIDEGLLGRLFILDGKLARFYSETGHIGEGQYNSDGIFFTRALDDDAQTWSEPVEIAPPVANWTPVLHAKVLNGRPVVIYRIGGQARSDSRWFLRRAADELGTSWEPTREILLPQWGMVGKFPSTITTIEEVGGKVYMVLSSGEQVFIIEAANEELSAWQQFETTACQSTVNYFGALIEWDGRLIAGYHSSDGGNDGGAHGVSVQLQP